MLIGVRGEPTKEDLEGLAAALRAMAGVKGAQSVGPGQLEVEYDPQALTVMDLLRAIRERGFLAGIL